MAQIWGSGPAFIYIGRPFGFATLVGQQIGQALLQAGGDALAVGGGVGGVGVQGNLAQAGLLPGAGARFLGTCERVPGLKVRPNWTPVFNDLLGAVPMDLMYTGTEAFIILDITRFNMPVWSNVATTPNPVGIEGLNTAGDEGSLSLT